MRETPIVSSPVRCFGQGSLALAVLIVLAAGPASAQSASSSCRASAARSSGPQQVTFEPVVANAATSPCVSQSQELVGVASGGGIAVTDPRAATEISAGTIAASASDDSAQITGATAIGVGHVSATQVESCSGGISVASGSSRVDGLTVAGTPVSIVAGQSIDQSIAGVRIRTNQLSGDTRQALVLDVGGTEYVLGEARAGGDACATLLGGGIGAEAGGRAGAAGSDLGGGSGAARGTLAYRLAASQLALQCPQRRITLIDVLQRGGRVAVLGAAERGLIGRKVTITLLAGHRRVASAVVGSDGFFGTTAALPPRRLRFTNRASYQASIASVRSGYLKLTRRMLVASIVSHGGTVTIRGRIVKPLSRPIAAILVKRRVSCSSTVTVKRIKPRRDGTFSASLRAPAKTPAALYLATTTVRQSQRSRRSYPTSTLPRVVVIQ